MIHPTSIIHPKAQLGKEVKVGPFSIIGEGVKIGARTRIQERVTIEGDTAIGEDCHIFAGAVLGKIAQDRKFKGGPAFLDIGSRNVIREYVTIHLSSLEGGMTRVGNDNLIMGGVHIAHDCVIGDDVVISNYATFAGHVEIENRAVIGGIVGIHQFVRVGKYAMIGGCSKAIKDVPPYLIADGYPAVCRGINAIGLDRAGIDKKIKSDIKKAYKILFLSGLTISRSIDKIKKEVETSPHIDHFIEFIEKSERGIAR